MTVPRKQRTPKKVEKDLHEVASSLLLLKDHIHDIVYYCKVCYKPNEVSYCSSCKGYTDKYSVYLKKTKVKNLNSIKKYV